MRGWIGVDLDGTLAEYHGWNGSIGKPIAPMVDRVKRWLAEGVEVRIMTARVSNRGGYSEESRRSADRAFVGSTPLFKELKQNYPLTFAEGYQPKPKPQAETAQP